MKRTWTKNKQPAEQFNTELLMALAFAAYRENNNNLYTEDVVYCPTTGDRQEFVTNKKHMQRHLAGTRLLQILDSDYENARTARDFLVNWCVLRTLQEEFLSEFVAKLKEASTQTENSATACGLFSFLPAQYDKLIDKQQRETQLSQLVYTSNWFGTIGQKTEFTITVLESKYVTKFNCYHVFGYTPDENCVSFFTSNRECCNSGTYTGRVKKHIVDSYNKNVNVTQFGYVKPVAAVIKSK
jgi:hypothetical protein